MTCEFCGKTNFSNMASKRRHYVRVHNSVLAESKGPLYRRMMRLLNRQLVEQMKVRSSPYITTPTTTTYTESTATTIEPTLTAPSQATTMESADGTNATLEETSINRTEHKEYLKLLAEDEDIFRNLIEIREIRILPPVDLSLILPLYDGQDDVLLNAVLNANI